MHNRTRLSRSIIEQVRRACGEEFIIGLAVSSSDAHGVLLSVESLLEVVALRDATGHVDYVTCGAGGCLKFERRMPVFLFGDKLTAPVTEQLKGVLRHAKVTSEAHIRTPEHAEAVIAAGQADLVLILRGQIADPHLARKTAEGGTWRGIGTAWALAAPSASRLLRGARLGISALALRDLG